MTHEKHRRSEIGSKGNFEKFLWSIGVFVTKSPSILSRLLRLRDMDGLDTDRSAPTARQGGGGDGISVARNRDDRPTRVSTAALPSTDVVETATSVLTTLAPVNVPTILPGPRQSRNNVA